MSEQPMSFDREMVIQLTRLETKIDMIGNVKDIASESLQSVKSAHHRIDKIDKIIFWGTTTIIGAFIIQVIGLIFYFVKK